MRSDLQHARQRWTSQHIQELWDALLAPTLEAALMVVVLRIMYLLSVAAALYCGPYWLAGLTGARSLPPIAHNVCLKMNFDAPFRPLGERLPGWLQAALPPFTSGTFNVVLGLVALRVVLGPLAIISVSPAHRNVQLARYAFVAILSGGAFYTSFQLATGAWTHWTLLTACFYGMALATMMALGAATRQPQSLFACN